MNSPREGKRLLVLDVDYTLFGERPHPPLAGDALIVPQRAFCVWRRPQVVRGERPGADEAVPARVPDVGLRRLRHCHLVYV